MSNHIEYYDKPTTSNLIIAMSVSQPIQPLFSVSMVTKTMTLSVPGSDV